MLRWLAIFVPSVIVAFTILFLSVLRTASVKYEFPDDYLRDNSSIAESDVYIEYSLPYHGKVLPDNPLWGIKAARDKAWLAITTNPERRAELYLLFADKRLGASLDLFEKGNPEEGLVTLIKAEMYLQKALDQQTKNEEMGLDTCEFGRRLSFAALKHYQLIEQIMAFAPDTARPEIIETKKHSISIYDQTTSHLIDLGMDVPVNPFQR